MNRKTVQPEGDGLVKDIRAIFSFVNLANASLVFCHSWRGARRKQGEIKKTLYDDAIESRVQRQI